MAGDDLQQAKFMNRVDANIESTLTLSLALRAAAKFSKGSAITEGEGLLGKTAKGTFNICYWVQVEGLSDQWVVRFPLIGMLPMDTMTTKFSGEIATLLADMQSRYKIDPATLSLSPALFGPPSSIPEQISLKFLREKTSVRVPKLIGYGLQVTRTFRYLS
jgi:hypothetical protein